MKTAKINLCLYVSLQYNERKQLTSRLPVLCNILKDPATGTGYIYPNGRGTAMPYPCA